MKTYFFEVKREFSLLGYPFVKDLFLISQPFMVKTADSPPLCYCQVFNEEHVYLGQVEITMLPLECIKQYCLPGTVLKDDFMAHYRDAVSITLEYYKANLSMAVSYGEQQS